VRNNATHEDFRRYGTGIKYIIVNGKLSVAEWNFKDVLAGKLLLPREER
jgi:hypothetical protein